MMAESERGLTLFWPSYGEDACSKGAGEYRWLIKFFHHRRDSQIGEKNSYRMPGDDGKRKTSATCKETMTFPQWSVLFAHRTLPMGKKETILCALCVSVVKKRV